MTIGDQLMCANTGMIRENKWLNDDASRAERSIAVKGLLVFSRNSQFQHNRTINMEFMNEV